METTLTKKSNTVEASFHFPQLKIINSRSARNLLMAGQQAGKTHTLGFISGMLIAKFPQLPIFIGANTEMQLSQTTLIKCFEIWELYWNWSEYDSRANPSGNFVMNKKPPTHFKTYQTLKDYRNTITFSNGKLVFIGSLQNAKAHDGKRFSAALLDETKDTAEGAVKDVIMGRLSMIGMFVDTQEYERDGNGKITGNHLLTYIDEIEYKAMPDSEKARYRSFNPLYIFTSPSFKTPKWLMDMFNLYDHEDEIIRRCRTEDDSFAMREEGRLTVIYSTYWNKENIANDYIEIKIKDFDKRRIDLFIYGIPFMNVGGEYIKTYDREKHVINCAHWYDPKLPLIMELDFNVAPYVTLLIKQLYVRVAEKRIDYAVIDEICAHDRTLATIMAFIKKYKYHKSHINIFGDRSGNTEQTRGESDYAIISKQLRIAKMNFKLKIPKWNDSLIDRQFFIEQLFDSNVIYEKHRSRGTQYTGFMIRPVIDKACHHTWGDFQSVLEDKVKGGKLKVKTKDVELVGHCLDAYEYGAIGTFDLEYSRLKKL